MKQHLSIIKWHLLITILCLLGLILLFVGKYLISIKSDPEIPFVNIQRPLVPIFAAVNLNNGDMAFVNEQDLGFKALDLSNNEPKDIKYSSEIDVTDSTSVTRSLSHELVKVAILSGKDKSLLYIQPNRKDFIDLPSGETAVFIQVYHDWMLRQYWNGVLYVVRDEKPVILAKLVGASEFIIKDMNKDGFKDIVRVASGSVVLGNKQFLIERVSWDMYSWNKEKKTFLKEEVYSDSFVKKYSIQSLVRFIKFSSPFLVFLFLGVFFRVVWMELLVILYFIGNLLFIFKTTMITHSGFTWALLLVIFQLSCLSMAFRLSKLQYDDGNRVN